MKPLLKCVIMICLFLRFSSVSVAGEPPATNLSVAIDALLEHAISRNLIAGGVIVIGNRDGILHSASRGHLNANAAAPLLDERTIFDIASLTKVVATTPAVMKLLDEGRITLADPLTRWFPEFQGSACGEITILNLLTHTSGLDDIELSGMDAMKSAIRKIATQNCQHRPGSRFRYADINFILLGDLVQRVSGKRLDLFCQEQLYAPLSARETMFLPPANLAGTIAPTNGTTGGIVQDNNARRLDGVAGHAGLFSSAADLARYARLILSGGVIDGKRILTEQAVTRMTSPHACGSGAVLRGLGWDMASPFSSPKGSLFSQTSFGHTGYSGSSIWIDPRQDLFVIMLTNRLNYQDTATFNQLRRDVSTLAVAGFGRPGDRQVPAPAAHAVLAAALPPLSKQQTAQSAATKPKPVAQLHKKRFLAKRAKFRFVRTEKNIAKSGHTKRSSARRRG